MYKCINFIIIVNRFMCVPKCLLTSAAFDDSGLLHAWHHNLCSRIANDSPGYCAIRFCIKESPANNKSLPECALELLFVLIVITLRLLLFPLLPFRLLLFLLLLLLDLLLETALFLSAPCCWITRGRRDPRCDILDLDDYMYATLVIHC